MPQDVSIGVIGGSGLYQIEGLEIVEQVSPNTPFGEPSDSIIIADLEGTHICFLPRHGKGHHTSPSDINNRANIYALKSLGVTQIISVSACGSLKEELRPRDIVICDQLVDWTRLRTNTFFGDGIVAHVSFADPYCSRLSEVLYQSTREESVPVHKGGTYITMEGPQFSTRAESQIYQSWGLSVIGMTSAPEAKLAREAEICYAILACVTDYDVWHQGEDVTIEMVIKNLQHNIENVKKIIKRAVRRLTSDVSDCPCRQALKNAIITDPKLIPEKRKKDLELIIGKYIS